MFQAVAIREDFLRDDILLRLFGLENVTPVPKLLRSYLCLNEPDFDEVSRSETRRRYYDLRKTWTTPGGFMKVFMVEVRRPEAKKEVISTILRKIEGNIPLTRTECITLATAAYRAGIS